MKKTAWSLLKARKVIASSFLKHGIPTTTFRIHVNSAHASIATMHVYMLNLAAGLG